MPRKAHINSAQIKLVPLAVLLGRASRGLMLLPVMIASLLFVGAASVSGHGAAQHNIQMVEFNPAPMAPDFSLPTLNGGVFTLASNRGQYVLLNFWATWCPPCVREMPSLDRLSSSLGDKGLIVVAVSIDVEGAGKVVPYIKRLGVHFPIALDPQNKVGGAYGARDLPSTFLIDPQGRVVAAAKGERDWSSEDMTSYLLERIERTESSL